MARTIASRWLDLAVTIGLLLGAAWLRYDGLGPSSLWLDDAWAALVVKSQGLSGILLTGATAPGFAAVLKGWLHLTGFSTLKAQLLPFLLGVATPPVTYLIVTRVGIGRIGALGAALMLAVSPNHVIYSTRVKQYTLDAVCTTGVICTTLWLLEDLEDRKRWASWFGVALASMVLSSPAIVVIACSFATALIASLAQGGRSRRLAGLFSIPTTALAALWAQFVLRPSANDALRNFWAGYYLPLNRELFSLGHEVVTALGRVVNGFSPFPLILSAGVLVIGASIVALRHPLWAALLVSPIALAVGLAMAELSPLGTGRTEIYLYPALALILGAALHIVVSTYPGSGPVLALVPLAAAVWAAADSAPGSYPRQDVAPLVSELEARYEPNEVVLIYPPTAFALCLYTSWPVILEETERNAAGFQCHVDLPNVYTLQGFRSDPETYRPEIESVAGTRVVWFIVSHGVHDVPAVEDMLREHGYQPEERLERLGAHLTRWVHHPAVFGDPE